ncbi:MAG: YkgJ family cysteine cluster protein [Candidatus Desulfatibia sp.]|uniref:YkgJ family cysteine cluster protein n=1 Tax=Candidatus Desulfatibia sp. TaxID=3101189 RepID=UPI002F3406BE
MNFDCLRCGRCCKEIGIPWSELDHNHAADCLRMENDVFLEAYGFIVNEHSGEIEHPEPGVTPCPFLKYNQENAVCKIYPVRPWICKGYPGPGISCRAGLKRS